jgi:acyl-coenzyme A synthetase/AMP-(fatty) acid ligase
MESRLTAEAVMEYVKHRVAPHKRIRLVEFIQAIPKSASGKILRRELRARDAASKPLSKL